MLILRGHSKDLSGGFTVRRVLPSLLRQAVGPFLFFDHLGPVMVEPRSGHDVRPHPHIGLATMTYLFSGAILHRDSLGVVQRIEPGAINWMSAGRGIVHSERRPPQWAERSYVNHGVQLWAALPLDQEESPPHFEHTPASEIPVVHPGQPAADGQPPSVRVLVGAGWGVQSPVRAHLGAVCLDIEMPKGSMLDLPQLAAEQAVYVVEGSITWGSESVAAHSMALMPDVAAPLQAGTEGARLMVVGGDPLDAPRHMWWNFVSSRKERIVEAARAWEDDAMPHIPGETERIPLPAKRFKS